MKAREFINEALRPSQYRKYVRGWDKNRWADIFGGKYRVYMELGGGGVVNTRDPNPQVIAALDQLGYEVTDYIQGYAVKKNDPRKQIVKIGKILSDTRFNALNSIKLAFDSDPVRRSSRSENIVVISRHPYDIAGMTSGRSWSEESCMNLDSGGQRSYVAADVKEGTIVGYLIKRDDQNIQRPLARILIKPFINRRNKDILLGVENRVYGNAPPLFAETVVDWANKINASKKLRGLFHLNPNLYNDEIIDTRVELPLSDEDILDTLENGSRANIQELVTAGYVTDSVLKSIADIDIFQLTKIIGVMADQGDNTISPEVQVAWCNYNNNGRSSDIIRALFDNHITPDEEAISLTINQDGISVLQLLKNYHYTLSDKQVEIAKNKLMEYYFLDDMRDWDFEHLINAFYKYGYKMPSKALDRIAQNGRAAVYYANTYRTLFPAGEPAMLRDLKSYDDMMPLLTYVVRRYVMSENTVPEALLDKLKSSELIWHAYNQALKNWAQFKNK